MNDRDEKATDFDIYFFLNGWVSDYTSIQIANLQKQQFVPKSVREINR